MICAVDYVFGANWIEQLVTEHRAYTHSCTSPEPSIADLCTEYGGASVDYVFRWSDTPQGYDVWFKRDDELENWCSNL